MLFDFSSAFNIIPSRLAGKLNELGMNTPLCTWILDILITSPALTPSSSLWMTVVLGLIFGNDEKAYQEEVANLSLVPRQQPHAECVYCGL